MDAVIVPEQKKEDWNEFVYNHPDTISWHIYEFHKVIEGSYKTTYYPLGVYRGDEICGILPLYHVRTLRTKDLLISCPYVVAGGIVADDDDVRKALLDKAISLSEKHNSCQIILKQYKRKNDLDLVTDENFYNRELNLNQSEEELWNRLSQKNQEMIREAETHDLVLEYPSNDVKGFYDVVFAQHHAKGIPCPGMKWIQSKWNFEDYSYKIALLKSRGETVSVTMAKQFKKTVSLPYSAMLKQDEKHEMFTYKLYWELIKRLSQEGIEIMHSGRIPNTDIVDAYRLGWGGVKNQYYYQYYPATCVQTEFAVKRGKKRQLFEKVWKRLPRGLVSLVGPAIVEQFP